MKTFAENKGRDENGWLVIPRDTGLRKEMYPEELVEKIMTHPAKMNAVLFEDIVRFVSEPGETVLDPFAGVGTTLGAAVMGRNVVLVELEQYYYDIIQECIKHLEGHGSRHWEGTQLGSMLAVHSDNRLALPIPCDHVITSPPYGNDLAKESEEAALTAEIGKQGMQYTQDTKNIGKLNPFLYQQSMNKVYKLIVNSVKPGGTITITHRDRMQAGQRLLYIDGIVRTLMRLGCKVYHLDKWKPPGSFAARVNEQLGHEIVEDEDVIIMRKET